MVVVGRAFAEVSTKSGVRVMCTSVTSCPAAEELLMVGRDNRSEPVVNHSVTPAHHAGDCRGMQMCFWLVDKQDVPEELALADVTQGHQVGILSHQV